MRLQILRLDQVCFQSLQNKADFKTGLDSFKARYPKIETSCLRAQYTLISFSFFLQSLAKDCGPVKVVALGIQSLKYIFIGVSQILRLFIKFKKSFSLYYCKASEGKEKCVGLLLADTQKFTFIQSLNTVIGKSPQWNLRLIWQDLPWTIFESVQNICSPAT